MLLRKADIVAFGRDAKQAHPLAQGDALGFLGLGQFEDSGANAALQDLRAGQLLVDLLDHLRDDHIEAVGLDMAAGPPIGGIRAADPVMGDGCHLAIAARTLDQA